MPALIRSLAVSGSRKSDGTANASGRVYLYEPGTTTLVAGYTSDTLAQAWTTTNGYIPLDAGGRVAIWVNDPVDIVIADSSGTTINTHLGFNKTRAEQVEIEHESLTGALTDSSGAVTQALGGKTFLHDVLTTATVSLGTDFQYQESAGATPRLWTDVVREIHITPQDFDAGANGIVDDTAAIVAAVAELVRLGGGVLYFPPGTYLISSQLDFGTGAGSVSGISIVGAGSQASTIKQATVNLNAFSVYASAFRIKGLTITHSSTSTGKAIDLQNCNGVVVEDVVTDGKYRFALNVDGSQQVMVRDNKLQALNADVLSRAFDSATSSAITMIGNDLQGGTTGTAVEVHFSSSNWLIAGNKFSNSAAGILYTDDPVTPGTNVPTGINVIGNPTLGSITTPIVAVGTATHDGLFASSANNSRQYGNGVDGYVVTQASGGGGGSSHTPDLHKGPEVHVRLTSGGAAVCTLNAPIGLATRDTRLTLRLTAAAGGAITWTFNAVYVLVGGGTTIAGADGTTTIVEFQWDVQTSEWRECYRSATAT
jgi:hypothetical protein